MITRIPEILRQIEKRPNRPFGYNLWNQGSWTHISSHELVAMARELALALHERGLKKGDRVGIYAQSAPYWIIVDFATVLAGGITVPFFANLSQEYFDYEAGHSSPKFLFTDNEELLNNGRFEKVFSMESDLLRLVHEGRGIQERDPYLWQDLERALHEDDIATIIYTSGSTGNPKGVELTHKNLTNIVAHPIYKWYDTDKYLSFLPLAHIFAKQVNYIMMYWGVDQYFVNDLTRIGDVCKEIHPTAMISVPRMLEKVYAKMEQKVQSAHGLKGLLGRWAWNLALSPDFAERKWARFFADKLVYSKLREGLGGKIRVILSGGAALNPAMQRFFLNIGVPIVQGWGMTEVSTIAVNRIDSNKVGTCGPAVPEAEFKISEEGELLARGPTIMRGYYKDPKATKEAIDDEGWFRTGDRAYLDEEGYLVILGRISESFKTSQGEFILPVPIEQKICESPLIEMAMVVGEGKPFAMALLFPNSALVDEKRDLIQEVEMLLYEVNKTLNQWERIHAYRIIYDLPTIEGGELTPTMKLRRKAVIAKYRHLIDEIYEEADAA
ncbi:MAG: long-chain fatty acid--CoA ligase [Chlamydiia bacterium]|nr:long-chain fatty acid--CoA ligase [Chlamydiia bacterium]